MILQWFRRIAGDAAAFVEHPQLAFAAHLRIEFVEHPGNGFALAAEGIILADDLHEIALAQRLHDGCF